MKSSTGLSTATASCRSCNMIFTTKSRRIVSLHIYLLRSNTFSRRINSFRFEIQIQSLQLHQAALLSHSGPAVFSLLANSSLHSTVGHAFRFYTFQNFTGMAEQHSIAPLRLHYMSWIPFKALILALQWIVLNFMQLYCTELQCTAGGPPSQLVRDLWTTPGRVPGSMGHPIQYFWPLPALFKARWISV